jgi:frataxin
MGSGDSGFETQVQRMLERIASALEDAGADDLDVDLTDGVLTIEDDAGRTYVINRHVPLKQIWLSSPVSGAGHYAWNAEVGRWTATRGGPPLEDVLAEELGALAGARFDFAT